VGGVFFTGTQNFSGVEIFNNKKTFLKRAQKSNKNKKN